MVVETVREVPERVRTIMLVMLLKSGQLTVRNAWRDALEARTDCLQDHTGQTYERF